MLAVVVLALLVGVSVTQVQERRAEPFLLLMEALLSISMNIVKWAMFLAPLAVFGLMAQLVMLVGIETLFGVAGYVGTVLLGLAALLVFYVALIGAFARVGPLSFLKACGSNLLLAFSTSSSSAVMPITIQTAREFGVPSNIANLVVPLGATMNMAGTVLYQALLRRQMIEEPCPACLACPADGDFDDPSQADLAMIIDHVEPADPPTISELVTDEVEGRLLHELLRHLRRCDPAWEACGPSRCEPARVVCNETFLSRIASRRRRP
jgi:hypothetical protein